MEKVNLPAPGWRRGSSCLPNECVEVAATGGYVLIRDSADKATGLALSFSRDQWRAFTDALRSAEARPEGCDENLIPVRLVQAQAA